MSNWDSILKIFDPLLNLTYKNYENNYLMYGIVILFLIFLGLVGYGIYKAVT